MAKMGRPEQPFDWFLLEVCLELGSTLTYVAEKMLVKEGYKFQDITSTMIASKMQLISRKIKKLRGLTYVELRDQKKEAWKLELYALQKKGARKMIPACLIWLGKVDLGQKEQINVKTDDENTETEKKYVFLEPEPE